MKKQQREERQHLNELQKTLEEQENIYTQQVNIIQMNCNLLFFVILYSHIIHNLTNVYNVLFFLNRNWTKTKLKKSYLK